MSVAPELTKSLVFNKSLGQVQAWLAGEYKRYSSRDLFIQLVSNPTNLRQLQPTLTRPDGQEDKLSYPFLLMTIGDITIDTERAGAKKNNATGGFVTQRNLQNREGRLENLRPVNVAIGVSFRTDSLDDVLDFTHAILMNYPIVQLAMELNNTFRVYTRLQLPENISTPPMGDEGAGDSYSFETVIILRTYIGTTRTVPLISEFKFLRYSTPADRTVDPFFSNSEPHDVQTISFTDYYNTEHPAYNSTYGDSQ